MFKRRWNLLGDLISRQFQEFYFIPYYGVLLHQRQLTSGFASIENDQKAFIIGRWKWSCLVVNILHRDVRELRHLRALSICEGRQKSNDEKNFEHLKVTELQRIASEFERGHFWNFSSSSSRIRNRNEPELRRLSDRYLSWMPGLDRSRILSGRRRYVWRCLGWCQTQRVEPRQESSYNYKSEDYNPHSRKAAESHLNCILLQCSMNPPQWDISLIGSCVFFYLFKKYSHLSRESSQQWRASSTAMTIFLVRGSQR